jgi:tetratricopeptide (TPR) repeat protein
MPIDLKAAMEQYEWGQIEAAAALFVEALRENPGCTLAQLGLELIASKTGVSAGESVSLSPDQPASAGSLATRLASVGDALWSDHEPELAIVAYRRSLEIDPAQPAVLCNLGASLVERGDLVGGIACFQEAIRRQPNLAAAHNNLARALAARGDVALALEHFRLAVQIEPSSSDSQANLARLLLERGQATDALQHAVEAVRAAPRSPAQLLNLGNVLQVLGRLDEAAACHREAIRLQPDFAPAHAAHGGVLEQQGDLEAALAALRTALRIDPGHAGALARLATRLRGRLPDADRATLSARLADTSLDSNLRISLLFGLAHVHDDRGEYDQAAQRSTEANALQAARLATLGRGYDPDSQRRLVDQWIEACSPSFFERVRDWGDPSPRPVFVVGLPRSGTSLVEQILASHPQVHGAGELELMRDLVRSFPTITGGSSLSECLERLDPASFRRLAASYLDRLEVKETGSRRVVDKMPENWLFLGVIAALLPRATIIHCRRSLRDVAISCWLTEFAAVRWSCEAGQIVARILESLRLGEHWARVLPSPVVEVQYEQLVTDLEPEARRLVAACGIDWDPACLSFHTTRRAVRTASAAQVRQPIHSRSIGRWKHYERLLPALFAGLPAED